MSFVSGKSYLILGLDLFRAATEVNNFVSPSQGDLFSTQRLGKIGFFGGWATSFTTQELSQAFSLSGGYEMALTLEKVAFIGRLVCLFSKGSQIEGQTSYKRTIVYLYKLLGVDVISALRTGVGIGLLNRQLIGLGGIQLHYLYVALNIAEIAMRLGVFDQLILNHYFIAPLRVEAQCIREEFLFNPVFSQNTCPISHSPIRYPYKIKGEPQHVYERDCIFKWISEHGTSPMTRRGPLTTADLEENIELLGQIESELSTIQVRSDEIRTRFFTLTRDQAESG